MAYASCTFVLLVALVALLGAADADITIKGHVYRLTTLPHEVEGAEVYVMDIDRKAAPPAYGSPSVCGTDGVYTIKLPDGTKTFSLLAYDPKKTEHATFSPEFDVKFLTTFDLLEKVDLQVVKVFLYGLLRNIAYPIHHQQKADKDTHCEIILTVGGLGKTLISDHQGGALTPPSSPSTSLRSSSSASASLPATDTKTVALPDTGADNGGAAIGLTLKMVDTATNKEWHQPWYFGVFPIIGKTNPLADQHAVSGDGGVTWPPLPRHDTNRYSIEVVDTSVLKGGNYAVAGAHKLKCPAHKPWNIPKTVWEETFILDVAPPAGLAVRQHSEKEMAALKKHKALNAEQGRAKRTSAGGKDFIKRDQIKSRIR